jgi:outer membrane protein OmpA-like peptidoglycan-associated protein
MDRLLHLLPDTTSTNKRAAMTLRRAVAFDSLPGGIALSLLCGALALPSAATAQTALDTVAVRAGGARIQGLVGVTGGWFDLHRGPRLDVLGARAGLGFGELAQLTGYYWRAVDTGERELLDDRAWGGEAQLNLNAGFGVTPFVTAGLARLRVDTLAERTAATVGAGLMLPVGPLRLTVSAQDHIFGVSGLDDGNADGETTHNWLFRAGATAVLGRPRGTEPVVVARAAPPPAPATVPADVRVDAAIDPDLREVRNYQSDRRIEVPLPLEGSITLRYGPEPTVAATRAAEPVAAPVAGPPTPGVAAPAPAQATAGLDEAAIGRIVERTVAALLPRLEARDIQRQNELRAELRATLTTQSELVRELVQQEIASMGLATRDLAEAPPATAPAVTAAPPAAMEAALQRATARLETARAELARIEAARAAEAPAGSAMALADVRLALADLSSRYPTMLTTAETPRGPAVVLADIAFETGAALPDDRVRTAVAEVAAALRRTPDRRILVQGHADSVGSEVANQQLSELRAEVVRSLLVQAGIEPARVHATGFGAGQPIATNATAAGRALNRRVEIVLGGTAWNGEDR